MRLQRVEQLKIAVRSRAAEIAKDRLVFGDLPEEGLDVSVGVAVTPRRHDYQLALRLRHVTEAHQELASEALNLADGEADVRYTGQVRAIAGCPGGPPMLAPLGIGASVGHSRVAGGTLGFFARRRSDGRLGLVSNNHVIADEDRGKSGHEVVHPSVCDGLGGKSRAIARLTSNYPRLSKNFRNVDCALALLEKGEAFDASLLDDGSRLRAQAVVPVDDMRVFKIGRTTRRTAGRVTAFNFDSISVSRYHFASPVVFRGQIEIESTTARAFSDPGDSGSLVFDVQNRPLGLLFAETASGGAGNLGLHYANPIDAVLGALRVDILV